MGLGVYVRRPVQDASQGVHHHFLQILPADGREVHLNEERDGQDREAEANEDVLRLGLPPAARRPSRRGDQLRPRAQHRRGRARRVADPSIDDDAEELQERVRDARG